MDQKGDVTVKEAKRRRFELGEQIRELIVSYEKETGVHVDDIRMLRAKTVDMPPEHPGHLTYLEIHLII